MLELHNIFGRHILLRDLRTLPVVAVGAIVAAVTVLAIPIALVLDVTVTLAVGLRVSCCKWAFRNRGSYRSGLRERSRVSRRSRS